VLHILQITLECGEIGRQASGAVMASDGETVGLVLCPKRRVVLVCFSFALIDPWLCRLFIQRFVWIEILLVMGALLRFK